MQNAADAQYMDEMPVVSDLYRAFSRYFAAAPCFLKPEINKRIKVRSHHVTYSKSKASQQSKFCEHSQCRIFTEFFPQYRDKRQRTDKGQDK